MTYIHRGGIHIKKNMEAFTELKEQRWAPGLLGHGLLPARGTSAAVGDGQNGTVVGRST